MTDHLSQKQGHTLSQTQKVTQQMKLNTVMLQSTTAEVRKIIEKEEENNELIDNVIYEQFDDKETPSNDSSEIPSVDAAETTSDDLTEPPTDDNTGNSYGETSEPPTEDNTGNSYGETSDEEETAGMNFGEKGSHIADINKDDFGDVYKDEYDSSAGGKSGMDIAENSSEGSTDPSEVTSLSKYLLEQLNSRGITGVVLKATKVIIENYINSDGHFTGNTAEIANEYDIKEKFFGEALDTIKTLDPAGVGANDAMDCLLFQLKRRKLVESIAYKIIIEKKLDLLAKKEFAKLASTYKVKEAHIKKALKIIQTLDPYPGRKFGLAASVIRPEIRITKHINGEFYIQIEGDIPKININEEAKQIFEQSKVGKKIVKGCLSRITAILMAIEQRNITINRVVSKIIEAQADYFSDIGNKEKLKPLTEEKIAKSLALAESTISRTVSKRYATLPGGMTVPLRIFFPSKLRSNNGRSDISSDKVKAELQDIVDGEAKAHPYTDEALTEMLKKRGINIKRRTVSKYREELEIPVKGRRKER